MLSDDLPAPIFLNEHACVATLVIDVPAFQINPPFRVTCHHSRIPVDACLHILCIEEVSLNVSRGPQAPHLSRLSSHSPVPAQDRHIICEETIEPGHVTFHYRVGPFAI